MHLYINLLMIIWRVSHYPVWYFHMVWVVTDLFTVPTVVSWLLKAA